MNSSKLRSLIGNDVADAVTPVLEGFECSEDFVWYLGKTISKDKVVAGVWAVFLGLMEEEWEHLEARIGELEIDATLADTQAGETDMEIRRLWEYVEELESRLATLEADKAA